MSALTFRNKEHEQDTRMRSNDYTRRQFLWAASAAMAVGISVTAEVPVERRQPEGGSENWPGTHRNGSLQCLVPMKSFMIEALTLGN